MRVVWDISHGEFLIIDHYYFSKLRKEIEKIAELKLAKSLEEWEGDILVLNYPEKRFSREEIERIKDFVHDGGRVIALGYYDNHDGVSGVLNGLAREFGMEIKGRVEDRENNFNGDPLFPVTSKVYEFNDGVERVLMPCSAMVRGGKTVVESESGAGIAGMYRKGGEFVLIGTCVFWDNFSIDKFNNREFAINLFSEI